MTYRAIFFDWDGTLIDSLPFLHRAHNHVREHFGFSAWSLDEYREAMKYSSRQLYPQLYGDRTDEAMNVLKDFVVANHLDFLKLMDGAEELLHSIFETGTPMGLVSNKRHLFLTREVEHLGLSRYFQVVLGAGEAANDKPSADPLLLAMQRAGLAMGPDVLYVGDTESDLECSANAGCGAAFLYFEEPENPLINKYNPEIVVRDCRALAARLGL